MNAKEFMKKLIDSFGDEKAIEKANFIIGGAKEDLIYYGNNNWSNYLRTDTEVCIPELEKLIKLK
ncbi:MULTISPECIES: hypothetical protein [Acinetobacter]|uniref:Uncharacterized protein n=1 Tax=Acinetobacter higginsii TaxID=70347 RepID=N9T518_9GAMM|nr:MULTISPECIES: hypothetical protein [Acinetobacter]ENX58767.1 hypothetical protein F902_01394 [Acinetobacter higginsii]